MDTFRIFVSSPGDVAEERLIARRVIDRLRTEFAGRLIVAPVFWEHEPLSAAASFQDQLPHPSDAHAAICILWARLGTRLPATFRKPDGERYASGTEFEFEDALAGFRARGWPALLVYRKTAVAQLDAGDDTAAFERMQQKRALDQFIRKWFHEETDGTLRAAFHPFEAAAEFEELLEVHLRKLIGRQFPEAVGAERSDTASWRQGSPFRGLQAFEFEHAPVFFGRTAAIAAMLAALRKQDRADGAFLLVLGASGSGKSSVVRAGLLPVLTQPGVVEGITAWHWSAMRPRDRAGSLLQFLVESLLATGALRPIEGTSDNDRLDALLSQLRALAGGTTRIALAVDQLEEVFSDGDLDDGTREQFFAALACVVATRAVWVIATLRSDFYPRAARFHALVSLKAGNGQYDLLAPSAAEIGQMIRLPAAAAGLRFEARTDEGERLDEVLRDTAAASPDALPLLEFALDELYKRRASDGTLTFAAYGEIGGVEGALAQRAEEAVLALPSVTQAALPHVLRRLIAAAAGGDGFNRRSSPLAELISPDERALVDALVAARLCVSELDHARRPVVSIAHEALLRHWPRVREWLEENRDLLRARARLAASAERWDLEDRRRDLLLSAGRPLDEASAVAKSALSLTETEHALVAASMARARRARRLRVGAVTGLAILAIAASTAAYLATTQKRRAETEASTTRETMDFMVSIFTLADPTEARANQFTVREMLDRGAQDVQRQLRDRPAVRSSLMTAMGRAYTGLGLPAPAKGLLTDALRDREALAGPTARSTTETRSALASALYLDGQYEDAARQFRLALASARQVTPGGEVTVASILNGLGDTLSQLGSDLEAESAYREALGIDERLFGPDSLESAQTLQGLASTLYFAGHYADAEPLMRRSLAIRRGKLGPRHWKVGDNLNDLGALYFQEGRYDQAAGFWKGSLAITVEWAGPDHPDVGSVSNNIGRSLLIDGKLDEAEPYLERALDLHRRTKPPDHDDLILPLNSLAMIRIAHRDFGKAEEMLDEARRIAEKQDHWMLDQVLTNLADVYAKTGRAPQAEELLARARGLLEKQYPRDKMPDEAWRYALQDAVLATTYAAEKKYPEARKLLTAALPIVRKRFGEGRYYTRDLEARLASLPR
ncbi:MAG: tetratricopeptide repeat protein [Steroidobacteraceae bacterium]